MEKPEIIILDEPANGLDPIGIKDLRDIILRLNRELKITFLVSSHLLDELKKFSNKIIIINNGRLKFKGSLEELLSMGDGNIEEVFSKEQIYEKIWGYDAEGDVSTVAEHIKEIRAKFIKISVSLNHIAMVWGVGYRWERNKI